MAHTPDTPSTLPNLPRWVTAHTPKSPEDVAFRSGAALTHLHLAFAGPNTPKSLIRHHAALTAAERCVTHQGRPERAAALRDAIAFLQPGDLPGPAGDVYLCWQRAVARAVSVKALHRALPDIEAEQIAMWLDAGQGAPMTRAASVMQAVVSARPRDVAAALILADAAVAHALGWTHLMPLLALGLKRGDLRKTGADLRLACHEAIVSTAPDALRRTADLVRRAGKLRAVAPKLRAKGAEDAIALFLTREAVAPTALTSLGSPRAARRFCDRLVTLGVARELTGRDTFRLYGV